MRAAVGALIGAWAGAAIAALVVIALDVAYGNELTTGYGSSYPPGPHIRPDAAVFVMVVAAVAGAVVGASIGAVRR